MSILHQVATLGPVGHLRPAPGTFGSLAALILALPFLYVGSLFLFLLAIALVWIIGHQATTAYVHDTGRHDPSELVIDEVVGQWIGLLPVVLMTTGISLLHLLLAFLLFRGFDIVKPWPIAWVDQSLQGATGVMLDDVFAGIAAALCLYAFMMVSGL